MQLENYVLGSWIKGDGQGQELYNAVTGDVVATASTKGLDYKQITDYARNVGYKKVNFKKVSISFI